MTHPTRGPEILARPRRSSISNPYCDALAIAVPNLAAVKVHAEANTFALFLVALMAEGGPLTIAQATERLVGAGIGAPADVERALKRCRPGRPPVYRHGERYHLDPFDHDASLWCFRLGLRPAQGRVEVGALSEEDAIRERQRMYDERSQAAALALARMRRAIVRGWPQDAPRALVVLDVDTEQATGYGAGELADARVRLEGYDVLAGLEIRPLLEGLGLEVAGRRLHELRPAQATLAREGGGPPIAVTLARLLKSSCGIARPWKSDAALDALGARNPARLLDALEADARDLAALYRYGRLHGGVRFRWYGRDATIAAPWVHWDEWTLYRWLSVAAKARQPLAVIAERAAPGADPWANAQWCSVYASPGYRPALVTAQRQILPTDDVQRLRVACPGEWHTPLPAEAAGPSTAVDARDGRSAPQAAFILRIRIELDLEAEAPPVWRVIEVSADATFWTLHVAIQDAMGWQDCHMHAFEVVDPQGQERVEIGMPLGAFVPQEVEPLADWTTTVTTYLNRERPECTYVYDFGDDWRHDVRLEAVADRDPAAAYPRCVAGARACPPEDVGGAHGFASFLAALADPTHEEHDDYIRWSGGGYDPTAFDPAAVDFHDPGERWVGAFGVA